MMNPCDQAEANRRHSEVDMPDAAERLRALLTEMPT